MPTPPPSEADMLHMQHASVVAVLARQNEAVRLKARRDALAKARRQTTAVTEPGETIAAPRRATPLHRPRPA